MMLGRSLTTYTMPTGMEYELNLSLDKKLTYIYMKHVAINKKIMYKKYIKLYMKCMTRFCK